MKRILALAVIVGGCLFLIPIFIVYASGYQRESLLVQLDIQGQAKEEVPSDIMDEKTLIGILAKEIPYTNEMEAIKVQAIVTRTYMARRILGIQSKGALVGYTDKEMKELWEDDYERIYKIYQEAVQKTANQMIFYNNQPIEALYHTASGGRTRDASEIYHQEIAYLKSVESNVDNISKQIEYTKEEMSQLLIEAYPDLIVDVAQIENQIQIVEKDEADYIKSLQVGNMTIDGEKFRQLLGLPSSNFKIFTSGERIIFDVRGIGHGVGLSENGANELAKQGMMCEDIIKYYYTDVSIEKFEAQR